MIDHRVASAYVVSDQASLQVPILAAEIGKYGAAQSKDFLDSPTKLAHNPGCVITRLNAQNRVDRAYLLSLFRDILRETKT